MNKNLQLLMSSANCLIDLKETRSSILTSTALFPVLDTISAQAASPRSLLLQARITLAPSLMHKNLRKYMYYEILHSSILFEIILLLH